MTPPLDLERKCLEMELRQVLELHRYESSMGLGKRGLMPHHIDALMADLMPFMERKILDREDR